MTKTPEMLNFECLMALGVLSTLHSDPESDVHNPVAMAHEIVRHCSGAFEELGHMRKTYLCALDTCDDLRSVRSGVSKEMEYLEERVLTLEFELASLANGNRLPRDSSADALTVQSSMIEMERWNPRCPLNSEIGLNPF